MLVRDQIVNSKLTSPLLCVLLLAEGEQGRAGVGKGESRFGDGDAACEAGIELCWDGCLGVACGWEGGF